MITIDLHTHTNYCDGENTPREMVEEAIKRGFQIYGFSGHSYDPCVEPYSMTPESTEVYKAEVLALKEEFKDKIDIFLGLEQDYYSEPYGDGYDYIIGSVHNVKKDGKLYPVDLTPELLQEVLDEHYGGDFESFAEEYFDLVSDVVNKTNCDIIGHLDVISKFFERKPRSLTDRYKNAALNAVRKLIPYDRFFEINVGAMTRSYRTAPYPAEFILKEINRLGGKIVINGDCHEKDRLGDFLEDAAALAKECGFSERWILTKNGWEAEKL